MNNSTESEIPTVVQQAIADGYSHKFEFSDGQLYCQLEPQKGYQIATCEISPNPCTISETIVYRIRTPDGIKGYAILDFYQDD